MTWPAPPDADQAVWHADHPSDGGKCDGSCLDAGRDRRAARFKLTHYPVVQRPRLSTGQRDAVRYAPAILRDPVAICSLDLGEHDATRGEELTELAIAPGRRCIRVS
jgi:hypothetical protein